MENVITTVNFHLTKSCNFKCKYCFAKFQDIQKVGLSFEEQKQLITQLAESKKFKKINFAGGEPSLAPHIKDLIRHAKSKGLETSIITNASLIDENWIEEVKDDLDILGISIDSIHEHTNCLIGRATNIDNIREIANSCHKHNIRLKINTVVSKYNFEESLVYFINEIKPFRWKMLQVTRIDGQNNAHFKRCKISSDNFKYFCNLNTKGLFSKDIVIPENEKQIIGSYIMIDYIGRFFDDKNGSHTYSDEILTIGVQKALEQIDVDVQKFIERKGKYTI